MKTIILTSLLSFSTLAQTIPQIVAFSGEEVAYPAPLKCFFSNTRMVAHGDNLLVNYTCFDQADINSEIWQIPKEGIAHQVFVSSEGNLLGDPASDGKKIFAMENNEGSSEKLWTHSEGSTTAMNLPANWNRVLVQSLAPMGEGNLLLRYTRDRISHEGYLANNVWAEMPQRGVNFFFAPGWSDQQIVQKVRLGDVSDLGESQPDEIQIRLAPLFAPVTVVRDRDADTSSPYLTFWNFSVVNGKYWLVSALREEGMVALVGVGNSFVEIPLYSHFKAVDAWPMAVDSLGRIVLRGTHHDGTQGLWLMSKNAGKPRHLLKIGHTVEAPSRGKAWAILPFYNAPLIIGNRVYIGVGVGAPVNGSTIGQGILEILLP